METQLQDVLSLWENAATEAKSESAAEVAELRKQARPTRGPQQRRISSEISRRSLLSVRRWSSCRRS